MKQFGYILIAALLLVGCSAEPPQAPSMILEGWIDANGYPVVLIHKSYVLAEASDSSQTIEDIVEQQLIPFGKVVVSDGDEEVILTGRLDTAYLPPYTYSSLNMVGQVGKTYTVTAKYRDMYASATTTIPPVAYLDSLSVRKDSMGIMDIRAYLSDIDSTTHTYYALFVRKLSAKQFQLCPFGVFCSSDAVNGELEMKLYNPMADSLAREQMNYYFYRNQEAYQLKLAAIDYASYQFWKAYNEQVIIGGVLFVPIYKNIPSNVSGGYGIFSGMGSSFYRFTTIRDTVYRYVNP